jgi:regulator of replication initiation timing
MLSISYTTEKDERFQRELAAYPRDLSNKQLADRARQSDQIAAYLLLSNHLEGIFYEAMNPLTREEVAVEMLGELLSAPIERMRRKAFLLLLKIAPDKIRDAFCDETKSQAEMVVLTDLLGATEEVPLRIMVDLVSSIELEQNARSALLKRIENIRKEVSELTKKTVIWKKEMQHLREQLDAESERITFLHEQIKSFGHNYPANPKQLQDLKLDIEMAYSSLQSDN